MIRIKRRHLMTLLIVQILFCACSKERGTEGSQQPLVLMEEAYTFNSETPSVLHNAQEIGVFLIESKSQNHIEKYVNLHYFADNHSATGYLVPFGNPIYLSKDEKVDAISYYPYIATNELTANTISQYLYNIDLSQQTKIKVNDFLYANNVKGLTQSNYKGTFGLKPMLSQVNLVFVPGYGINEERLKNMKISICGMPSNAQFDLLKGEFLQTTVRGAASENSRASTNIPIKVTAQLTASAIIYSSFLSDNVTFELTLPAGNNQPETSMTWSLNNLVSNVEENTLYKIQIKFGENGMTGTLIEKSFIYISNWNKDEDITDEI